MMSERMISNKKIAKLLGKDHATVSKWVTNISQEILEIILKNLS